jgi:hypothetical protein
MAKTWRITALGINGKRVVLDRHLSRERAEELRQMLAASNVFQAVYVELDDGLESTGCLG